MKMYLNIKTVTENTGEVQSILKLVKKVKLLNYVVQ